jgi:hypothetical protein
LTAEKNTNLLFLYFATLLVRLFDAAIYFWMPQINILILRLIQGRNLRHRMVGRSVVIGDIPWVAQSAEAFLSKVSSCAMIFAVGCEILNALIILLLLSLRSSRARIVSPE